MKTLDEKIREIMAKNSQYAPDAIKVALINAYRQGAEENRMRYYKDAINTPYDKRTIMHTHRINVSIANALAVPLYEMQGTKPFNVNLKDLHKMESNLYMDIAAGPDQIVFRALLRDVYEELDFSK